MKSLFKIGWKFEFKILSIAEFFWSLNSDIRKNQKKFSDFRKKVYKSGNFYKRNYKL